MLALSLEDGNIWSQSTAPHQSEAGSGCIHRRWTEGTFAGSGYRRLYACGDSELLKHMTFRLLNRNRQVVGSTPALGSRIFREFANQERNFLAHGHQTGWMSRKDCKHRRAVSSSANRLPSCSIR
jgi:hypothetical protein